jgi:hypothetical protein
MELVIIPRSNRSIQRIAARRHCHSSCRIVKIGPAATRGAVDVLVNNASGGIVKAVPRSHSGHPWQTAIENSRTKDLIKCRVTAGHFIC